MCSVLRPEPSPYCVRTILPKGGVPPPVGYPLPVARPRHRASPHQCSVWPLHRQSGPSSPDTLINLVAVELRPGELSALPGPHRARARLRSPPCIPHRPTLRGLDERCFPAYGRGLRTARTRRMLSCSCRAAARSASSRCAFVETSAAWRNIACSSRTLLRSSS